MSRVAMALTLAVAGVLGAGCARSPREAATTAPAPPALAPLPAPTPDPPAPPAPPLASAAAEPGPEVEVGVEEAPGPAGAPARGADPFAPPPSAPVPAAPPPPPDRHPASFYFEREEPKIRARLAQQMRGMSPAGAPIDTPVTGVDTHVGGLGRVVRTLRIPVARGYCYGLVARESYDLNLSLNAQAAVDATFYEDGGDWVAVYLQTAALTAFCPQSSGAIVVRLMLDHRDPLPAVAAGTFRVQLFRKPIADGELRARAEKHETEMRQRSLHYVCGHCTKVLLVCRLNGLPGCTGMYLGCLQSVGVTPADCERGDVAPPAPRSPWDT